MNKSYRIFIDDTSDIGNKTSNNPQLRYASISAVIMADDYRERFDPAFYEMVAKHFGLEEDGRPPCVHRRRMIKPRADGPFAALLEDGARERWELDVRRLIKNADYKVITSCIDKVAFYYHHPNFDGNIYDLLVELAIERFSLFLHYNNSVGDVVIEAADPSTDRKLSTSYRDFMEKGNEHHTPNDLARRFSSKELKIEPKTSKIPGLQLTDLIAKPAFAHCLNEARNDASLITSYDRWVSDILVDSKFYRSRSGTIEGYGRVWRPQKR